MEILSTLPSTLVVSGLSAAGMAEWIHDGDQGLLTCQNQIPNEKDGSCALLFRSKFSQDEEREDKIARWDKVEVYAKPCTYLGGKNNENKADQAEFEGIQTIEAKGLKDYILLDKMT